MHGYYWGWPMVGMMIGWLVLIVLVIVGLWIAIGYGRRPTVDRHEAARRILGERYARGELDTEEYHRRLEALR